MLQDKQQLWAALLWHSNGRVSTVISIPACKLIINPWVRVWEETGVTSSDALRKMLVKRSLSTAGVVGLQTLLDAGVVSLMYIKAINLNLRISSFDFFSVLHFLLFFMRLVSHRFLGF